MNRSVWKKILLIACALGLILTTFLGFFSSKEPEESRPVRPLILVSVPPYKKMIESLVGDTFAVESVVPNGFDPHLYEAKPRDMKRFKDAAFWFGIGEAFELKVLEALRGAKSSVSYYNLVDELVTEGHKDLLIPFTACAHDHDHDHDHGDHCGMNTYDRHLWLGLELDSIQAELIYEKLCVTYPHLKGIFEANLQELIREHDVLVNWIESNLKDFRPIHFVTPHPAFGYFAKEFDLIQIPIEVAGKEPNIQDLNNLLNELKTTAVDCVILEPQHSKKAGEKIAHDLNIPVYTIDPYNENYLDTCNRLCLALATKKNRES